MDVLRARMTRIYYMSRMDNVLIDFHFFVRATPTPRLEVMTPYEGRNGFIEDKLLIQLTIHSGL